jgi:CO dehydrogenase maturation factor
MLRVAVGGKGGVGKTTVASLMARILARRGFSVVAIDGDPNPNLAISLGIPREAAQKIRHIPHDLVDLVSEPDGRRRIVFKKSPTEIIRDHAYRTHEGIAVLSVGTVEEPGKGCLCGSHAVMREFVRSLLSESKDVVVYDMEASIEHMGRGTVKYLDILLLVVEPYYKAVETAKRMARLARELGIKRIYAIANKIKGEKDLELIKDLLEPEGIEILDSIPYDEAVLEAEKLGISVLDHSPRSGVVVGVERIIDRLLEISGLKAQESSEEQTRQLRGISSQCPYRVS